jgi:hypothetical protein
MFFFVNLRPGWGFLYTKILMPLYWIKEAIKQKVTQYYKLILNKKLCHQKFQEENS